jgi:glycosyltransferase involved in cell wall biosynthesis
MRVGVFVSIADKTIGGGYTFQHSIASSLDKIKTKHDFIIFNAEKKDNSLQTSVSQYSLKSLYVPKNKKSNYLSGFLSRKILSFFYAKARCKFQKKSCPEDYIINLIDDFKLDIAWYLLPIDYQLSIPYIITVWDLQHRMQPYFPEVSVNGWTWDDRERFYRRIIPKATLVATGTNVGKEEIIHFYTPNPANVRVIPFPTPEYINKKTSFSDQDILKQFGLSPSYLFYPAKFWPHKNHINLLKAIAILRDKYNLELEAVFVGSDEGNEEYVRTTIKELKVKAHILGFVPAEAMASLYRQAMALIFPTFFGPDNIPPLEAFALGCPVAASKIPGAEEQLGDAAILFNPADPQEIANAIFILNENQEYRLELIKRGYLKNTISSIEYTENICRFFDEFENIRACWK